MCFLKLLLLFIYSIHVFSLHWSCRLGGVPVDFEEVHLDSTVQHIDNVQEAITSIKRNGVAIKGILFMFFILIKPKLLQIQSNNFFLKNSFEF